MKVLYVHIDTHGLEGISNPADLIIPEPDPIVKIPKMEDMVDKRLALRVVVWSSEGLREM